VAQGRTVAAVTPAVATVRAGGASVGGRIAAGRTLSTWGVLAGRADRDGGAAAAEEEERSSAGESVSQSSPQSSFHPSAARAADDSAARDAIAGLLTCGTDATTLPAYPPAASQSSPQVSFQSLAEEAASGLAAEDRCAAGVVACCFSATSLSAAELVSVPAASVRSPPMTDAAVLAVCATVAAILLNHDIDPANAPEATATHTRCNPGRCHSATCGSPRPFLSTHAVGRPHRL
jgi:hypothetical protein